MPPFVVLLLNTLTALVLLFVGSSGRLARMFAARLTGMGALPLLDAAVLSAFVFGEDDYRDDGISRWQAYRSPGGALGPMFVASVALLMACAVLVAYTTFRGRRHLLRLAAFVGGLASLFLVNATILGFSLN